MKSLRYMFAGIGAIALVAILLGYTWHVGSLAICVTMLLALKKDEEERAGRW